MPVVVAAFYHFFDFPHFADTRADLLACMKDNGVHGSILIADEGFNGTVAGTREGIDVVLAYLRDNIARGEFGYKESYAETMPFPRSKVRLKKETISLGVPVNPHKVGTYVEPKDWDALTSQPDVILLDSRNDYEVHLGTFKGAIDPKTKNFKELPDFIDKTLHDKKKAKIATFCTGGIRCEKLTSWLLSEGYEEVYHLKGGILQYLEEIPPEHSSWEGECFVFDRRVAVGHGLAPSTSATMCRCGQPLTPEDRAHPKYIEWVSCAVCAS